MTPENEKVLRNILIFIGICVVLLIIKYIFGPVILSILPTWLSNFLIKLGEIIS
ncbi:MAG: hypothetical protein L6266_02635 [Nanoarchaeota archaeon]|nr:hypothetical protein [Nanoarchaeota archaeon]